MTGLFCHRRLKIIIDKLDASVGASGPHDFAVRAHRHPSLDVAASTASRTNVRDDRDTPLSEEAGRGLVMLSWGLGEEEYFLRADWTGCVALNLLAKFVF